ncbi:hypothetical protein NDU88_001052, partial [Pleurodeles waltl]
FLDVPGTAWSGPEGEVLFTRLSWPQDFPKQRRRKEQGSLMFPGQPGPVRRERSCSPGCHGPRISQNKEGERN